MEKKRRSAIPFYLQGCGFLFFIFASLMKERVTFRKFASIKTEMEDRMRTRKKGNSQIINEDSESSGTKEIRRDGNKSCDIDEEDDEHSQRTSNTPLELNSINLSTLIGSFVIT